MGVRVAAGGMTSEGTFRPAALLCLGASFQGPVCKDLSRPLSLSSLPPSFLPFSRFPSPTLHLSSFLFLFFHSVEQAGLELTEICLPQPHRCSYTSSY